MSKRADRDLLSDMQEAIRRIGNYTAGMVYQSFLEDTKTQDAVIRNLEIIGEAAKKVSADLQKSYPRVPWKAMAGLRDRLIHHYFGINLDIVWHIATVELPEVAGQLEAILREEGDG